MNDAVAWLNRSWPLGTVRGLTVRVSLWLLIAAGVSALALARTPWLVPVALAAGIAAMVLHAVAHAAAIRLAGGQVSETTASALVEICPAFIPPRWGVVAWCAGAGPAANALAALACHLAAGTVSGFAASALGLAATVNALVAAINLLACAPFDGRLLWRGLLWPLLGLRRSGLAVVVLGYLSAGLLLLWGLAGPDLLGVIMGIICIVATVRDHRTLREGGEPALDTLPHHGGDDGLLARWERRRRERTARRDQADAEADQAVLDRLLAKVSAGGLPALTPAERATLQRISERQKRRAGR